MKAKSLMLLLIKVMMLLGGVCESNVLSENLKITRKKTTDFNNIDILDCIIEMFFLCL